MTKELQKRGFKSWKHFDEMWKEVETSGKECVECFKARIKELEEEAKEKDVAIEVLVNIAQDLITKQGKGKLEIKNGLIHFRDYDAPDTSIGELRAKAGLDPSTDVWG